MTKKNSDSQFDNEHKVSDGILCVTPVDPNTPIDISNYPTNTAIIRYKNVKGVYKEWAIGALKGEDNEQTLREYLERWVPGAIFVSCAIK